LGNQSKIKIIKVIERGFIMLNKLLLAAIASALFVSPLLAQQTNYDFGLSKHKGNKIVMLGNQRAEDTVKWRQVIDSDGIYEHGFALLGRENLYQVAINTSYIHDL
jgi:hypothetical protein